jgi:hypothetical protein
MKRRQFIGTGLALTATWPLRGDLLMQGRAAYDGRRRV